MIKLKPIPLLPFAIIMTIAALSLTMLYSISGGSFSPWCIKQIWRVLLGVAALIVAMNIKTEIWRKYALAIYMMSLVTLALVAVIGKISMGAQRWIKFGALTLQPSELMRISLVILLARYFSTRSVDENKCAKALLVPTLITTIPVGFVLLQPDLGTAMLIILTFLSVLFVCGVEIWKFVTIFISALISVPILWKCLYEYQKQRILMFLNPEMDPSGAGYHIIQAKIALGSGGFWGKGLLNGTQIQLDFLPEKQTDFIFVALGEELGFIGCTLLLFLYVMLFIYNYKVVLFTRSKFTRIMVFGINAMIFFYVIINILMVCGLFPVVGIPLPFFSYGGNALLVIMFSQGIIFAADCEQSKK